MMYTQYRLDKQLALMRIRQNAEAFKAKELGLDMQRLAEKHELEEKLVRMQFLEQGVIARGAYSPRALGLAKSSRHRD